MRLLFIILVGICCQLSAQEIKKVDSDVLFTCYKQGKSGDCVSVGITKAAICVFGINGVFKERIIDATHTEVTLKNGKKYTLLKEEFEMADSAMHVNHVIFYWRIFWRYSIPELESQILFSREK